MTQGRPVGGGAPLPYDAPPGDTGEALGLPPSRLTLTFGFGPTLFRDADGKDRFGLADRQPSALRRLPHFPGDQLEPGRSDGDLCVQACADDPQVAVHAIRNLVPDRASARSALRWAQLGFGRTSSTSTPQATPRNLFGFKDGTANLKAEDAGRASTSTSGSATPTTTRAAWLAGGSLPRRPPDQHAHRDLGPHLAAASRSRSSAATVQQGAPLSGGQRVHRARLRRRGPRRQPLIADGLARPAGAPDAEQRRPDAASRLQLHRRQRRPRPPRRGAVLHRLRARPRQALHPDAERSCPRTTR